MLNAKVRLKMLLVLLGMSSIISSCDSKKTSNSGSTNTSQSSSSSISTGNNEKEVYAKFYVALKNTYEYEGDYYAEFVRKSDGYKEETIETIGDGNKFYCENRSYKDSESGYVLNNKTIEAVVSKDNRYVYYEERGIEEKNKEAKYISEKSIKKYTNYSPSSLYEDTILMSLMETTAIDKIEDIIKEYGSGNHLVYDKHSIIFDQSVVTLTIDFNVDLKGEEEAESIEYAKQKDTMSFTINDDKVSSFKTKTEIEYKTKTEEKPITSIYEFNYDVEYSYKSGLLDKISLDGIEIKAETALILFYYGDYQLRSVYYSEVGKPINYIFDNYFFNGDGFYGYDMNSGIIEFYLDEEFKVKYTNEPLPSDELRLYIKITVPSDRAIVMEMSQSNYYRQVNDEDTNKDYVKRVDKMFTSKSMELEGVTYNFDKREEITREYVTVNGEKCEDKEITLEDGKLYEIVYYYDYANRF